MKPTLTIVCTGGRDYHDYNMIHDVLSLLNPLKVFVGDAMGADALVKQYCVDTSTDYSIFKADWEEHGKAAGPIRNGEMLYAAGVHALVIAFPGGKGTENCIKQAVMSNNIVFRVVR